YSELTVTSALSLHDALPISPPAPEALPAPLAVVGHSSVLEFGPVLLASTTVPPGTVVTASGGVPNLWNATDSQLSSGVSGRTARSEEHTSELQSRENLVCRL